MHLAPEVFCPTELENQRGEEYEQVLQEERDARVDRAALLHDVLTNENVTGTHQRSKSHQEAKEKPNFRTDSTAEAFSVGLPSQLIIADRIDHKHGHCTENTTQMEHIHGVSRICRRYIKGEPPAREEKESGRDRCDFVAFLPEVHVTCLARQRL